MDEGPHCQEVGGSVMKIPTIILALMLVSSAHAARILTDGDPVDIDGTRIRIQNIDTPETFRSRCENELISGPKQRLREILDSGPVTFTPIGKDRWRSFTPVAAEQVEEKEPDVSPATNTWERRAFQDC